MGSFNLRKRQVVSRRPDKMRHAAWGHGRRQVVSCGPGKMRHAAWGHGRQQAASHELGKIRHITWCLTLTVVVALTLALPAIAVAKPTSQTLRGDVNGNGLFNIVDVQAIYDLATGRYDDADSATPYAKFPLPEGWSASDLKNAADANGDGTVDSPDARFAHIALHEGWPADPEPDPSPDFPTRRTKAGAGTVNQGNLVLVIRFAGDTTGDFDQATNAYTGYNAPYYNNVRDDIRSKWEYLVRGYNCVNDAYMGLSVRDYLYTVSEGKHDLISTFPQTTADGRVEYITMGQTVDSYFSNGQSLDYKLIGEAVSRYNAQYGNSLDGTLVDTNADGWLDNLTLICQVDSSLFTSHSTTDSKGVSITTQQGALNVANFNVIDSVRLEADTKNLLIHEYTHTLGVRDLYVKEGQTATLKPVGIWDMMSSLYGTPWMLAETRASLGWTTIDEVTQAGQYTLTSAAGSGPQAIMVKSPLNSSEYFIVEYRQKAANPYSGTSLDTRIGGNGVIVYRVNPLYRGEGNGNVLSTSSGQSGYYLYVFRPGDDESKFLGGSGYTNDLLRYASNAQLSLSGAWSSVGSTDLTCGFADGALTYSDGTNSGIQVSVVADGAGCQTVEITFANYASLDSWDTLGAASTPAGFASSMPGAAITSDGTNVYASASDNGNARIWKYDGTAWSQLGGQIPWSGSESAPVLCLDGEVYALSSTYSAYSLLKYDAAANTWRGAGAAAISTNDTISQVQLISFMGKVALAYANTSWKTVICTLEGSSWTKQVTLPTFYTTVSAAADGRGNTFLLLGTNSGEDPLTLVKYGPDGNVLSTNQLALASKAPSAASLAYSAGSLYVAAAEGNKINAYCAKEEALAFTQVGDPVGSSSNGYFNGVGVAVAGDKVVCAYADSAAGSTQVRSHAA